MSLSAIARKTMKIEAQAILEASKRINDNIDKAVDIIVNCKGRIVITGMGKSGIIAKKIASTLSSTGTPAIFLHPAEGGHGELGVITKDDCVIAVSNSGETDELIYILPVIKLLGVLIISIVGNVDSTLARKSDCIFDASVKKEACPLNLAPTASTTVALAIGDALSSALLYKKGIKEDDFAFLHPAGMLGKKLLIKVEDIFHTGTKLPKVSVNTKVSEAIVEMTGKGFGCTTVVDEEGKLFGILTDGDLRRILQKYGNIFELNVEEVCTKNPKLIDKEELAAKALKIMEDNSITSLIVVDDQKRPYGIIHIHDILRRGIT